MLEIYKYNECKNNEDQDREMVGEEYLHLLSIYFSPENN